MVEDGRKASLQLPRGEEERPVDVRHELFELHLVEKSQAGELRAGNRVGCPLKHEASGPRCAPRQQRAVLERGVLLADPVLLGSVGRDEGRLLACH